MCACFKDRLIFQLQAYEYVHRFKTKNDLIRFEFMATNLVVHLLMQEGHLMIYLFIHPLWGLDMQWYVCTCAHKQKHGTRV